MYLAITQGFNNEPLSSPYSIPFRETCSGRRAEFFTKATIMMICKDCNLKLKYHSPGQKRCYVCSKKRLRESQKAYKLKHPEKIYKNPRKESYEYKLTTEQRRKSAIYNKVHRARQKGRLVKKPCEICGGADSVAHHEDYNKPLDVVWLCRSHHRLHHNEIKRSELDRPK